MQVLDAELRSQHRPLLVCPCGTKISNQTMLPEKSGCHGGTRNDASKSMSATQAVRAFQQAPSLQAGGSPRLHPALSRAWRGPILRYQAVYTHHARYKNSRVHARSREPTNGPTEGRGRSNIAHQDVTQGSAQAASPRNQRLTKVLVCWEISARRSLAAASSPRN